MKINIPSSLRIKNLIENKKFTVSISVILSFIIWLTITIKENPIREQTFTDLTANISIENTAAAEMGLGIISDVASQKFSVTVSGPNYIVSSLKAEDFALSASVIDVNAAGTYTLEILGSSNSDKSGYTITSIYPSTIDVTFDYIDTKEFTLQPKLVGVSAANGLVAETPVFADSSQDTITIKGPRSIMDKIATVGAVYEVNKTLDTSQTFEADVVLYNSEDKAIYRFTSGGEVYDNAGNILTNSNLSLSFTTVKLTQPISKKASVPCKPVFTNLPSGLSESDISYKIDTSKVTIIGAPEIIDKTKEILLSPIDFRNVSKSSNVFEVSATLSDGVKILETIEYFTVSVDVSTYSETTLDVKSIRCTGLSSDLTAKTDTRIKNVKICGPSKAIRNISASDLYAVVDLTDKSAGVHTLDVVIKSDVYDDVWQVGTYSTSVTLK